MINIYRSTDAGAPALNSTVGSLIAVLDACLVDGYGGKSPAGWTKAFTGTAKAAYRMPATDLAGTTNATVQGYLRVEEFAQTGNVRMYESMTDVDTGGHYAPSGTTFWPKSGTDGDARPWALFTDGLTVYFCPQFNMGYSPDLLVAGEYLSFRPADVSPLLITGYTSFPGSPLAPGFRNLNADGNPVLTRNYVGDAANAAFRTLTSAVGSSLLVEGLTATPYPGLASAGFVGEPMYIQEFANPEYYLRGAHPGVVVPFEQMMDALPGGYVVTNVNGAPGRSFEVVKFEVGNRGVLIDVTGPWR
jgi:hypothetical protein